MLELVQFEKYTSHILNYITEIKHWYVKLPHIRQFGNRQTMLKNGYTELRVQIGEVVLLGAIPDKKEHLNSKSINTVLLNIYMS